MKWAISLALLVALASARTSEPESITVELTHCETNWYEVASDQDSVTMHCARSADE